MSVTYMGTGLICSPNNNIILRLLKFESIYRVFLSNRMYQLNSHLISLIECINYIICNTN